MRVAVIGAQGFIGRHLCDALAMRRIDVLPLSSRNSDLFDPATGVLTDRLPADSAIDALVYLSQSPHYRDMPRDAAHLWGVNVTSAIRAVNWARRAGARRILHASTGTVYAHSFLPHREHDPVRRDDWYALSKCHAEETLRLFADVNVTSMRLFGVFGPQQRGKLVPNLAAAILAGRDIHLQAHPASSSDRNGFLMSVTYIDDAVAVMLKLLEDGGPHVLNVAGPEVVSIRGIATALGERLGIAPVFAVDAEPRRFDLIADNTLASEMLGGRFTAVAGGLDATVAELRTAGA